MNTQSFTGTILGLLIFLFSGTNAWAECKVETITSLSGNIEYRCGKKQSALYVPHEVRNKSHDTLGDISPRDLIVEITAGDAKISSWVNSRGWGGRSLHGGLDTRALYIRSGEDAEKLEEALLSGKKIAATVASPDGKTFTLFNVSFASTDTEAQVDEAVDEEGIEVSGEPEATESLSAFEKALSHALLNHSTGKRYLDRTCVLETGTTKRDEVRDSKVRDLEEKIALGNMRPNQLTATENEISKLQSYESASLKADQILGKIISEGQCRSQELAYATHLEECQARSNAENCECASKHFATRWVSGELKEWPNELDRLHTEASAACR